MTIPTEPIGSIPRSPELQAGMAAAGAGTISAEALDALFDDAVRDTLERFAATGSPVVTDGEQRKPSFATYPVAGLALAPGGRDHPVRGRPHARAAGPHDEPVPIRDEGATNTSMPPPGRRRRR